MGFLITDSAQPEFSVDTASAHLSLVRAAQLSVEEGRVIKVKPGSYELSASAVLPGSHQLDLTGCVFTRTNANAFIGAAGSVDFGSEQLVTADTNNINRPQSSTNTPSLLTKVFVSTGRAFSQGEWVIAYSNQTVSVSSVDGVPGKRGSLRRVLGSDVPGVLIKPLYWNLTVADVGKLVRVDLLQGGTIIGGTFQDASTILGTANASPFFKFSYVLNQVMRGQTISNLTGKAQDYIHCVAPTVEDQSISNLPDNEPAGLFGYGCAFSGTTINGVFRNNRVQRCRHGFTTDRPFAGDALDTVGIPEHCWVSNNVVSECTNNGIDTHKEGHLITIEGNTVRDGYIGIAVRSPRSIIKNNVVTNSLLYGIWVTSWAANCEVQGNTTSHIIRDVVGNLGGYGIQSNSPVVIDGNVGFGNQVGDILLASNTAGATIKNNLIRSDNGITVGANSSNINLLNNIGIQTSTGFFLEEQAGCTNTQFIGNRNQGSGILLLNGNALTRYALGNSGITDTSSGGTAAFLTTITDTSTSTAIAISAATGVLINEPPSVVASRSITLPSGAVDGQKVTISFSGALGVGTPVVTSLTINPPAGTTLSTSYLTPVNALVGDVLEYVLSGSIWQRTD